MKKSDLLFSCLIGLAGCSNSATSADAGHGFAVATTDNGCPGAILVSASDYTSTNVSALSPAGEELVDSFISSQSGSTGLSVALSGDVVFPSSPPTSGRVVLLDRYPNSVLSFVDPATGEVQRQISVGTGFGANPHDYLEITDAVAYVTRYEANPKPGREDYDAGSDILVVDPTSGKLGGSIDLTTADDGDFLPRPDRLLRVGDEVWVTLQGLNRDFSNARDQRIVGIDPKSNGIIWTLELTGFKSCGKPVLSPSGTLAAIACSGFLGSGALEATPESDVVLLDVTQSPPAIVKSFGAAEQLKAPLGSSVAFASETLLVGTAFGDAGTSRNDRAYTLDTETGQASELYDAGTAFALGEVLCTPGCGEALCLLADAEAGALSAWTITEGGALESAESIVTGESVGLPPRALGSL